ncbi:unnamed protein product [Lepeophtheirus salmonis]|uniref:(salmon louse) hypothetical protein n=1 Tax=Lepeophtheirus salmonis TaxID=72036 RepID=A0A7R8H2R0_LEPSM|nr:unnamed protein product [Lepeophtheirus salmonis]CAF2819072.1 unnamed protein product [Lepeophtheirus salmonis]
MFSCRLLCYNKAKEKLLNLGTSSCDTIRTMIESCSLLLRSEHEIVHISNKLMNSGKKCIQHREPISMFYDGTHIINGTNKENKSSTSIISSSSNTNIEENSFSETFHRSQIIERDLYHHCQIFEAQLKEQKFNNRNR